MRILYSHRIQSRDGQSVHVEQLIAAFREAGHEVMVVGPAAYEASHFGGESRMVALVRRVLPAAIAELAELAYNVPAYFRLARACAAFRPDIIYERYNLYYLAGTWLARHHGLPLFLEVNSPLAEERVRFGSLRLQKLAHVLEGATWRAARRVLAVTGVLKDRIAAAGVDPQRIEVIQNGVVLDRFPPSRPRAAEAEITLGFVGFVRSWHGLDAILRAIAAHQGAPRIGLTVVGDGPARPELEALAESLGIAGRVRFTGLLDHEEVPGAVAEFDIALQPK
ncbi:MAG TPA: glycosyltransferase, partial [Acetobacteraceae bacterium]